MHTHTHHKGSLSHNFVHFYIVIYSILKIQLDTAEGTIHQNGDGLDATNLNYLHVARLSLLCLAACQPACLSQSIAASPLLPLFPSSISTCVQV